MQSGSSPDQTSIPSTISSSQRFRQIAYAADLARETSIALRLSHTVTAASQMLLQRFYATSSLQSHCAVWVAGACVLLASKINGASHSLRHIANVLHSRMQDREGSIQVLNRSCTRPTCRILDFYGAEGYAWKVGILNTERAVLCVLGFNVAVDVPHRFILVYVNALREHAHAPAWTDLPESSVFRALLQFAWNYANDALLSPSCASERSDVIACACIYNATVKLGVSLPKGWQAIFGASSEQSCRVGQQIINIYELGQLRGTFTDFSRTKVFTKFHPSHLQKQEQISENASQNCENSSQSGQRKRMRFADACP